MVGAHNALWTYGQRTSDFDLPRMKDLFDYSAAKELYSKYKFPNIKIVLDRNRKSSRWSGLVLKIWALQKYHRWNIILKEFDYPVYAQLNSFYYTKRKDGKTIDSVQDFFNNPKEYESDFSHFCQ